jgi:hypothetical protein
LGKFDSMKKSHAAPELNVDNLLQILQERFENHPYRHPHCSWKSIQKKLEENPTILNSLLQMEQTGGEPDVVELSCDPQGIYYIDCSEQSPTLRRSLCYDKDAWEKRKEHKPSGNACDRAAEMGVTLLDEMQYHALQEIGSFDTKTSSWLRTDSELRAQGGALFGDKRYGRTFIYHNGADSYYGVRGFRAFIKL